MIIFGTRSTNIANEELGAHCSHCQSKNTSQLYVFQHYFHVFWIPAFPLYKSVVSECTHCKQVLRKKEFGAELQQASQNILKSAKAPWWTFLILIAVVGFIALISLMGIFGPKQ